MAKSSRAYRGAKRGKELKRLKKQEEKRLRRLGKKEDGPKDQEAIESETGATEHETPAEQAPEEKPEEPQ